MPIRFLVVVAVALLAGCSSGGGHGATSNPTVATTPSVNCDDPTLNRALFPQCPPLEGPATQLHHWPNGFGAQVAEVQKMDPSLGSGLKPGQVLIKVTVVFSNTGTMPIPLDQHRYLWRLLSSPNRFEANNDGGWNTTGDQLTSPVPERVAPGQSVTLFDSWDVPADQLASLAVRVDLDGAVVPWVFTDAQTLLKG